MKCRLGPIIFAFPPSLLAKENRAFSALSCASAHARGEKKASENKVVLSSIPLPG